MLEKIVEMYLQEKSMLDEMETVAAPSGEWEEYNYSYMLQETRVEVLEDVLSIMGYDWSVHYEES